jgi:cytochrome c-type biogenesis protein CcmH/NrfF
MRINKRKFAILLGFLYSIAISADPIFHALETDHPNELVEVHESIDCQVCENESFKASDLQIFEEYALVKKLLSAKKKELNLILFLASARGRHPTLKFI